jgi:hypothetical protein
MAYHIKTWTFAGRWHVTQRAIRVALGVIWIFDAALQYQPRMWGHEFVSQMISPMAAGQPAPVAWVINNAAHLIGPDPGVWNFIFATLQLAIGVGLLVPRTVKPALVTMFVWSFGVWWIGEGFGQILTAHTSPLTGAPGAVLVYALIGVLVWPRSAAPTTPVNAVRPERALEGSGFVTAAGAQGPFGMRGALGAWAGLWSLFAVLWLLPANRAPASIHEALSGMASGQPGWYAHVLESLAGAFRSGGAGWAWILAIASLVVGLGPLVSRRVVGFFVAGAVLELAFWVSGQAFGGVLTGMGTDPSVGPLVVLLALAVVPAVVEVPVYAPTVGSRTPPDRRSLVLRRLIAWNPIAVGATAAGLGAVLLLASTYPVPGAQASSSSTVAAMPGMNGSSGGTGVALTTSQADHSHSASATSMNGTMTANPLLAPEAMGAADPSWHYDGPSLTSAETRLLTQVSGVTDSGHAMQTPVCSATPTSAQLEYAVRLVQETSADVSKYKSLSAATAAGYIPVTNPAYPVVHYVNPAYMQNRYVLDPSNVDSLVYATTPYGTALVAAMYLMPSENEKGPMPAGCMLQWHAHTNLCVSSASHLIVGFTPCRSGTFNYKTPVMSHVWQVPVPGGPLALDPSDLQTVEAAIVAQQCGEAPYDPSSPPPPPAAGECSV